MINPCIQTIPRRRRQQPLSVENESSGAEPAEQQRQTVLRNEQDQVDVAANIQKQTSSGDF